MVPFSSGSFVSLSHPWFQVSVHLEASPAFLAVPEKEQETYCICENGRQTVSWAVTPKSLGERQPLIDNSVPKDCMYIWDPYIQAKNVPPLHQMVECFSLFHSRMSRRIPPFPHLHLFLGVSVSLASSLCYLHSCSYIFINQNKKSHSIKHV